METLRVLELFSGIGGLHWGLKETGIPFEVVAALEINPTVLETYSLNFPDVKILRRNIESLSANEVNDMNVTTLVMSPPCQPFCRTGLGQGLLDKRSSPLSNVLQILPDIKTLEYIFVENVKGFETSEAREKLVEVLEKLSFNFQEFLISPSDLGIPNSRLRYYLIGKRDTKQWSFSVSGRDKILSTLPDEALSRNEILIRVIKNHKKKWNDFRKPGDLERETHLIQDILEPSQSVDSQFYVDDTRLSKYLSALDIVTPGSSHCCCFTKAYFHYMTGTGSILRIDDVENELTENKLRGKYRYFTPREVARLLCYPEHFQFPSNHSPKQCYKALGNSVNVHTVALMFSLLFD